MHKAIKAAAETAALRDARESLRGLDERLDDIEAKLDRVLALLEQGKPQGQPQQRGGR